MADPILKEKFDILTKEDLENGKKLHSWNINIRDDQLRWLVHKERGGKVWLRTKNL